MRWLLVVLALMTVLALDRAPAASAYAGRTTIALSDSQAASVTLAAADEDAFFRRINTPPKLDDAPDTSGPSYRIASSYWDTALRGDGGSKAAVEDNATYFPDGGFVRARQGGKDTWIVLDLRQRAILDRYIRLAKAGALPNTPGVLDVVRAAAESETIGIDVSGQQMTDAQAAAFWAAYDANPKSTVIDPPKPPEGSGSDSAWLTFTLAEGRVVSLLLAGSPPSLTDHLGAERYQVSPGLSQAIAAAAPESPPRIKQEGRPGSNLWWPLMIGGGLLAIGVAAARAKIGSPRT